MKWRLCYATTRFRSTTRSPSPFSRFCVSVASTLEELIRRRGTEIRCCLHRYRPFPHYRMMSLKGQQTAPSTSRVRTNRPKLKKKLTRLPSKAVILRLMILLASTNWLPRAPQLLNKGFEHSHKPLIFIAWERDTRAHIENLFEKFRSAVNYEICRRIFLTIQQLPVIACSCFLHHLRPSGHLPSSERDINLLLRSTKVVN